MVEHVLVATFGFPAVVFTFLLVVVVGYWLLVAVGLSSVDAVGAADPEAFGRVPLSVSLTVATALSWLTCLAGDLLLSTGPLPALSGFAVLLVALTVAFAGTRLVARVLAPRFQSAPDVVGRTCVIRTGRVDRTFGEAEVTMGDGTSVVVQVRQRTGLPLRVGGSATVEEHDRAGGFFWISG
ncbi:hypothetical protein V5P93_007117 [Actinokineospora auranticolor]|uniref:Uncharacterized protein n=1 Tax=Actinokineospora auranticolor TaxID=155976 RepID=A0A2S6GRC0_9PSEU|nr:hypothetical protein [Actinokineospora auranticolor]PPK67774.1 hypothetical protein CLV40_1064 [Actinokineospora auranticolor]